MARLDPELLVFTEPHQSNSPDQQDLFPVVYRPSIPWHRLGQLSLVPRTSLGLGFRGRLAAITGASYINAFRPLPCLHTCRIQKFASTCRSALAEVSTELSAGVFAHRARFIKRERDNTLPTRTAIGEAASVRDCCRDRAALIIQEVTNRLLRELALSVDLTLVKRPFEDSTVWPSVGAMTVWQEVFPRALEMGAIGKGVAGRQHQKDQTGDHSSLIYQRFRDHSACTCTCHCLQMAADFESVSPLLSSLVTGAQR